MRRWMMTLSAVLAVCLLLLIRPAGGKDGAPPASDFQVTTLAKGANKTGEPMAMAVLPDRRVLHTSRDGRVWLTTPQATTSLAGTIPVYTHDEDGLQGIAIDANFSANRWVYVYYAPLLSTPSGEAPHTGDAAAFGPFKGHNQLSRIKLTTAGRLDLASEQRILQVPADRGICCHAGGEIDFDADGNLYLSTGDDTNPFESDGYSPIDERPTRNPAFDAQRSSANTNDLRGKLLRIKVRDDGTYSSPSGNLFPAGTDGTRPEIYAMGFRNPFRFAVDPHTGWVFLGDYGPDAGGPHPSRGPGGQVEFNLIKSPGNYGWPYCHGNNDPYNDFNFATGQSAAKFNPAAPQNDSPHNTGLASLPPAQPAWITYDNCSIPEFGCGSESPMGGETYRFEASNAFPTRLPQYFDGKNFAYEFGRGWLRVLTVGADGELLGIEPFLDTFDFKQLINAEFGPDGSLYLLDYGTGNFAGSETSALYRIDYTPGARSPAAVASADHTSGPTPLTVMYSSEGSEDPDGDTLTYAWDLDGDGTIDSTAEHPSFTYQQPGRFTAALTVSDATGQTGHASANVVAGNTAPTVTIAMPYQGGVFDYGETIKYVITVTDPEDGTIDCSKARLDTALGHNEHTHGDQSLTGCAGQFTIPAAWEDKSQHSFYVLSASYTDAGVATPGLEITSNVQVILEHRTQQAEYFDAQQGTQNVGHVGAEGNQRVGFIQAGDWLRFDEINLSGIDSVVARVSSAATGGLQFRTDSPTGSVIATVPVPDTGGFDSYLNTPAVPITDPGGTHDLYIVFTADNMDLDEFTLQGLGVTGNASPMLAASAQPTNGTAPLAVDFTAHVSDPEGTAVSLAWDFGVDGAPMSTTEAAAFTYTERGIYTAGVTATDADGRTSVRTISIEVDSQDNPRTDHFTGTALEQSRWTRIVREAPAGYRVQSGELQIDALPGDMYGGDTSAKNIVGQTAPDGPWTATTRVTLGHLAAFEQAGMLLYDNDANFMKLVFINAPSGRNVEFIRQTNGVPDDQGPTDRSLKLTGDTVYLRLHSDGTVVSAAYSLDGSNWVPVGRLQRLHGFAHPAVALSAFHGVGTPARFDYLILTEAATPASGELP